MKEDTNQIVKEEEIDKKNNKDDNKKGNHYMEEYIKNKTLPSLSFNYDDKFKVGVALSERDFLNEDKRKLVSYHFNSITCENEMKAELTLDRAATLAKGDEKYPVINMDRAEAALSFAKENNLKMRGHTLVWYSQTPRWFFTVGFDDSPDATFVSKEVMLARMENYIKQVIEYVNTNYPGIIYAWDVVNEAIEVSEGHVDGLRMKNNYWYEVIGDEYIEYAFTFARKYASKDQKLFYNDYSTYDKDKLFAICKLIKKLQEKNLIDGMGMQSHLQLIYPTITDYQYAIEKYGQLGIEIQITELDIDNTDNTKEGQELLAIRYKNIFKVLLNCLEKKSANITSITFWGLSDDRSWLNKPDKTSYPLLFDKDLNPKDAFFGVLQDSSIKNYTSNYTHKDGVEKVAENDKVYNAMIEKSLITTGNNYRMKSVMEKAKKGENITVAYIGGSITEGGGSSSYEKCYANLSFENFIEKYSFASSNLHMINAGIGGTPSSLGIIRFSRDLIKNNVSPDLIFIEFAVNDYNEPTGGKAYESMIRKALNLPSKPAVVLIFSVFKSKWNMQDIYEPLGSYYNLPMISVKNAIVPELVKGTLIEKEFFSDEYHPNDFGHKIMADCISFYFDKVAMEEKALEDVVVPTAAKIGNDYENIIMVDGATITDDVLIKENSFSEKDMDVVSTFYSQGKPVFPNGWRHGGNGENTGFTMDITCRNLMLVFKSSSQNTYGDAEVYVDGNLVGTYKGYDGSGWNNAVTVLLLEKKEVGNHKVEIKMAAGHENKEFTILAFGYTK